MEQNKILVIPDVHLKAWMFDQAEAIMKSEEISQAVFLGDLVDDFNKDRDNAAYEGIFTKALKFDKNHPNTLWCYGNHDLSYLWRKWETGYSTWQERTVVTGMHDLQKAFKDRLAFAHVIGKCLFTHGGVTWDFLDSLRRRGFKIRGIKSIEDVKNIINECSVIELWQDESPLWSRPVDSPDYDLFSEYGVLQVTGHTPVLKAWQNGSVLFCDTFSTYPDGTPYGDQSFQIVNSDGQWLGSIKHE